MKHETFTASISRRDALKGATAAAFVLAIETPAQSAGQPQVIAGWLKIAPDNATTILTNTSEIGQGTSTALAQLLADELDADWKDVRLEMAPLDAAHINAGFGEYATYGSGGVQYQTDTYRTAGARARIMLIQAAADSWRVPASELGTDQGAVVHPKTGRRMNYGALAARAARLPVPAKPNLKPRDSFRYIGRAVQRLDIPSKTNGTAVFGIDVKVPGMKVATIMQSPTFGGKLKSVDPKPALAIPGVENVVPMASAVAVVATGYWQAKKGLDVLKPQWDLSAASHENSNAYRTRLTAATAQTNLAYAPKGTTVEALARAHDAAMTRAKRTIGAVYEVPFLSHATMEPMNATARPIPGGMEMWLPTQTQQASLVGVAKLLGVSLDKVVVHTTLAGGGFGRRGEIDYSLQAAEIAHKVGAPVKLIWSREEDLQHDWYRPAAAVKITAGVDAKGNPVAWRFDTACSSLLEWALYGANRQKPGKVDPTALMGLVQLAYALAAPRFGWKRTDAGVPVTFWRSVGQSQNMFALESFVDELAAAANRDPIAYRRSLLATNPRVQRVFDAVVKKSGWTSSAPKGRSRGYAMAVANGSVVAHVAEISVSKASEVRVHRMTCVADCGLVVNPGSVAAQMQGGTIFGLAAAFLGEVTVENGRVQQSNFHDYPLVTMAQAPEIDVTILDSDQKAGGAGEEAVAGVAPAVANALFAATGRRVRRLPIAREGFTLV